MNEAASYRTSNKVEWYWIPLVIFGCIACSMFMAILLFVLRMFGWYLIFLVPFGASMLLGAAIAGMVYVSKCRNPLLAVFLGSVTGLAGYFGSLFIEMVLMTGDINPVSLVSYLQERVANNVVEKVGEVNAQPAKPNIFGNSLLLLMDVAFFSCIPAFIARNRSLRSFCEPLNRWNKQETCHLAPGHGALLAHAFNEQKLEEFVPIAQREINPANAAKITLEYCPSDANVSPIDYPIYLSVTDPALSRFNSSINLRTLEPDEVLDLLPLFPLLAETLKKTHGIAPVNKALDRTPDATQEPAQDSNQEETLQESPQSPARKNVTRYATSQPVTADPKHKLMDWRYSLIMFSYTVVPLLSAFGMIAVSLWLSKLQMKTASTIVGISGAVVFFFAAYLLFFCMGILESRWTRRRFQKLIARRPDAQEWINDSSKRLVGLIANGSVSAHSISSFSDILWLKLDDVSQSIRMLGDKDNYQIPVESIVSLGTHCSILPTNSPIDIKQWSTLLDVQFDDARRQLFLSLANTKLGFYTNRRRQRINEAFAQELIQFCQRHQPKDTTTMPTLPMAG